MNLKTDDWRIYAILRECDGKKKAEEYIAKDKVNAVVESFRSLNDEQRLICFKLLQGLI